MEDEDGKRREGSKPTLSEFPELHAPRNITAFSQFQNSLAFQCTGWPKTGTIILYALTLPNINR